VHLLVVVVSLSEHFLLHLKLKLALLIKHAHRKCFHGQVVLNLRQFYVDALHLGHFVGTDIVVSGKHFVLFCLDVHHLFDIQTCEEVFSDDVRCPDDNIVNIAACKCHQNSLLYVLQRILIAAVILDHLVVPNAHIQEVSLLLRQLESLNNSRMHNVTTSL